MRKQLKQGSSVRGGRSREGGVAGGEILNQKRSSFPNQRKKVKKPVVKEFGMGGA